MCRGQKSLRWHKIVEIRKSLKSIRTLSLQGNSLFIISIDHKFHLGSQRRSRLKSKRNFDPRLTVHGRPVFDLASH
jgi:hypothetical protein